MNEGHLQILSSPQWAQMLEANLLPWLAGVTDLGDDALEVGPGPGLTTDLLRERTAHLTAIELDEDLAEALAVRLGGTNVEVVHGDAAATGFEADRFSVAMCFGMLHHVPSPEQQDQVFAELHRVLRPSGMFVVTDGIDSEGTRRFHDGDVFVPLDPTSLAARVEAVGFTDVVVEVIEQPYPELRFHATKPGPETDAESDAGTG